MLFIKEMTSQPIRHQGSAKAPRPPPGFELRNEKKALILLIIPGWRVLL